MPFPIFDHSMNKGEAGISADTHSGRFLRVTKSSILVRVLVPNHSGETYYNLSDKFQEDRKTKKYICLVPMLFSMTWDGHRTLTQTVEYPQESFTSPKSSIFS